MTNSMVRASPPDGHRLAFGVRGRTLRRVRMGAILCQPLI